MRFTLVEKHIFKDVEIRLRYTKTIYDLQWVCNLSNTISWAIESDGKREIKHSHCTCACLAYLNC